MGILLFDLDFLFYFWSLMVSAIAGHVGVSGGIHGRKFCTFHRWKIGITAELAKLSDMELKFKCTSSWAKGLQ